MRNVSIFINIVRNKLLKLLKNFKRMNKIKNIVEIFYYLNEYKNYNFTGIIFVWIETIVTIFLLL